MLDAKADALVPSGPMRRDALTKHVKRLAKESGFDYVGITTADDLPDAESVAIERLRQGLMDGLPWYYESRVQRGCRPTSLLPGARSIIALGLSYYTSASPTPEDGKLRGRIARYAWGEDYHKVMERRAKALVVRLRDLGGESARFYVDYGPMPDRAVAQRAGIGWFGKNTNLLTPGQGSWLFLAELLTTLDLTPDAPLKKSCGQCTLCIPACPTNAIPEPYVIDSTRCISYHTIENRGPIPLELRPLMGDWVFGCDVCQDVCPVNDTVAPTGDAAFQAASVENERPDLLAILSLTQEQFRERFKGSPVRRAKLDGLKRNACVALGNLGDSTAVPSLVNALREDEALVRGHAAWALGHIGGEVARAALTEALVSETDVWVREEIQRALDTPN
ncbi:MAG: tRNA epoxyqueuosine(34) reductase QueG [Chloroflexi bacterium]|nr:tRNA epoxyqueuosine(34) reductase QueG [Chloroflexota bacterium]